MASVEPIDSFESRASEWIAANLPSWEDPPKGDRFLQQTIYDGGFAGIAFPTEYGGAGLTLDHQKVFFDAAARLKRQVPTGYGVSIGMLGPTLLEHASHESKLQWLPPLLRGDEVWIQLLSEPRGGSDMAGAITRLTRDGDSYILNGSKMWSTGAHHADWGLCLCRTNWDAPKHRGLSMIGVPLKGTPGVTIEQIRSANGMAGEFCQEFFDDVSLPSGHLVGEENKGWGVAQTLLFHERNAVGGIGYGYLGAGRVVTQSSGATPTVKELLAAADRRGVLGSMTSLIADAYIDAVVGPLTSARIMTGMKVGTHQGQWGSLLKLQGSEAEHRTLRGALSVLGAEEVIWEGTEMDFDKLGATWLISRGATIAGGTSEMQRNIISERLLALPREPSDDRDLPFNEVQRRQGRSQ